MDFMQRCAIGYGGISVPFVLWQCVALLARRALPVVSGS